MRNPPASPPSAEAPTTCAAQVFRLGAVRECGRPMPCESHPFATAAAKATALAQRFHEAYERLAPSFGYATREESAKPWAEVPENNRRLMTAVCAEILFVVPPSADAGETT